MRTSEVVYRCGGWAAYEYQSGIEVLVVLLDVVGIVLGRLPLVHGVEVEARIAGLDWLEESSESILEAASGQQLATKATECIERTTWDRFGAVGTPCRPFQPPP